MMDTHAALSDEQILSELQRRFDRNLNLMKEQAALLDELRALNKRLIDAERLKGNFLSNIRNEINNPLASMLGMTKLMSEGGVAADRAKQISTLLHSECFRLDFHLHNIFYSAELEAGETNCVAINFNVIELFENTISDFSHEIAKRKLTIDFDTNNELEVFVHSDAEKLRLVFSNLLSNAIQFNQEGGSIYVKVLKEDGNLIISVKDTGIGINPSDASLIFDRFRQLEEGSTKRFGGQGLGLSVCKAVTELLGGNLDFESQPNEGATFIVSVPVMSSGDDLEAFSSDGNDFLFGEFDQIKL
jgi:signal transduction histidine kinase